MAGSFGFSFLFFSALFFGFMFLILSQPGAATYLSNSGMAGNPTSFTVNNSTSAWDYGAYFIQHPFTDNAIIGWIMVAIFLVDAYIIITSVIP